MHWHTFSVLTVLQSFIGGVIAFKVLPRPSFSTLQAGIFPIYFAMQTALPAAMALTYPGTSRIEGGLKGLMVEQNRWSVLAPIGTMFVAGLVNLAFVGPATTQTMKDRKHQGPSNIRSKM